jgi:hypothetical protein
LNSPGPRSMPLDDRAGLNQALAGSSIGSRPGRSLPKGHGLAAF